MISDESHIQETIHWLKSRKRLLIAGHSRPDGDCLGSALALGMALPQLNIECTVVSADPVPQQYQSLPGADQIRNRKSVDPDYDGILFLECGSPERSGLEGTERFPALNIDHHPSTTEWAQVNWINSEASAVGEMVYSLLESLKIEITPGIASNLFAAIMTDTGSFLYSNTSENTFLVASRLLSYGASPAEISRSVYMNQKPSRLRLLSRVLGTLEIDESGKIAVVSLTREDLENTGAADEDTEGFVNYPLSLEGIEASVFLRQVGEKSFRVSLRSKTTIDVSEVASRFGGGGHVRAAGFSLNDMTLDEARKLTVSGLRELL